MNEQAVIIGASGLIGGHLLEQMLGEYHFNSVRVLVRRKLPIDHPKLQQVVVDFNDIEDLKNKLGTGDAIFCCIGTTQKNVKGDKAAYEKIDHDIPVNAAWVGATHGFKKFLIVSSAGANPSASNFYLSLKGRVEKDVRKSQFRSIGIFRPSMLLGKRVERRPGEKIMQGISNALSFLFVGPLKKYHPIRASDVAKAMIAECKLNNPGVHILHYNEMMELIR